MTSKQLMQVQIKIELNYQDFLLKVQSMNHNKKIDIKNLLRTISPFFKTVRINNLFYICFKGTDNSIRLQLLPLTCNDMFVLEITSSKHRTKVFTFCARSHRHLLEKLIKHDLV
jgi:hypothetical protein